MSKENIGDVIARTLEGEPPATVSAPRTIETITEEIEQLKARGGEVLLEIGKRLIEAKAQLQHGEWQAWLAEKVDFSERHAQELMQIAREFSNPRALADLGKTKVLKLLLLPPAERDEFLETHDVPNMSTRELEQAIRERDEAKAAAEYSEKKLGELSKAFDESQTALENEHARTLELNTRIKELESRPVDVAVQIDEAAVKKAADEAREAMRKEMQIKLDEARDQAALAVAEAEQLRRDAAELLRRDAAAAVAPMITPMWYTGLPTVGGRYYCRFNCDGTDVKEIAEWDDVLRLWHFLNNTRIEAECTGWWPVPGVD